jgi:hypothetical protein
MISVIKCMSDMGTASIGSDLFNDAVSGSDYVASSGRENG